MKKLKGLIAFTAILAMTTGQLRAEECGTEDCSAYCDSGKASYMAALLPIGALVVAAVIIATTDRGHHHHHSSSSSSKSHSHHSGKHHHHHHHHSK